MQSNFFNNPPVNHPNHGWERLHALPFSAVAEYHAYGFKWTSAYIRWYVDGQLVRTAARSNATKIPEATDSTARLMANTWAVTRENGGEGWAGRVPDSFQSDKAQIRWIRHATGDCCDVERSCASA
jgi:beta-glucanase (GH16 family)